MHQQISQLSGADEGFGTFNPLHFFGVGEHIQDGLGRFAQQGRKAWDQFFAEVVLQPAEAADKCIDLLGQIVARGQLLNPSGVDGLGKQRTVGVRRCAASLRARSSASKALSACSGK